MFDSIKYVTGGFTLVAFLVAAIALVLKSHLNRKANIIRTAPETQRAQLVEIALEGFRIDTTSLTKEQKFNLLMTQMAHKAELAKKTLYFGGFTLLIATIATVIIVSESESNGVTLNQKKKRIEELNAVMVSNYQQEMYGDSEAAADEILKLDPNHFRALSVKGAIAIYDGDARTAVKYFQKGLQNAPDSYALKRNLAYAYIEIGADKLAIDLYESANDGDDESMCSLGRAHLYAGDFEIALKYLEAVPSTYSRGLARILEATSYAGLQKQTTDKKNLTNLESKKNQQFKEGFLQDSAYWDGIFSGIRKDKNTSYTLPLSLLGDVYSDYKKGGLF
jgi:tetratricopeptide (TPR) repeat protein